MSSTDQVQVQSHFSSVPISHSWTIIFRLSKPKSETLKMLFYIILIFIHLQGGSCEIGLGVTKHCHSRKWVA